MISITFLGTGTSQGVPVIACDCDVCQSTDKHDKRLRTSALLNVNGTVLVIDAGPDFREQMLREKVNDIDALLLTHEHRDHIAGIDDVRAFNFKHDKNIPVYADCNVEKALKSAYPYIFNPGSYTGAPRIDFHEIVENTSFFIKEVEVIPIRVMHGNLPIFGFRIGKVAYLTDVLTIEESELKKLNGLDILVISALHWEEHYSHLNIPQAIEMVKKINPKRAYFTHFSHRAGKHQWLAAQLPENISPAYDQLVVSIMC